MEDYKPNSHLSKMEQSNSTNGKKIEKVVSGTVKVKKKSEIHKIKDIFVSEDAGNIKSYILNDVLIPTIKQTISDIVKNVIDMTLFGGNGSKGRNSIASTVSYRNYYDRGNSIQRGTTRTTTGYNYDDITIDSRGEAEEVLTRMDELISCYGVVSVADLYDLIGVTGSYTDNKYGWTNIRNARVVRANGGGWTFDLPKALPID